MKGMRFVLITVVVMATGVGSANAALFAPDFESYTPGSVVGQDGWVAFAAAGGIHPDTSEFDTTLADIQETEISGQFMPGNKYLAVGQIGNIESQNKHRNGLYRPFTPTAQVHLEVLYSPRQSETSWRSVSLRDSSDAEYATVAAMVGSSKNYSGSGFREFFVVDDSTGDNRVWYNTGTDIVKENVYKIVIDANATTQTYDAAVYLYDTGVEVASWSNVGFSRTTGATLSRVYIQSWDSQSDWDHLSITDVGLPLPGDVDGSGYVDGTDRDLIIANWGKSPATRGEGDLNSDNAVTGLDYTEVITYWNTGTPEPGEAIPEPATICLLALAGTVLLAGRRRQST